LPDLQTTYPSYPPTLPRLPTNQPQAPRLPDLQTTYPSLPRLPTQTPQPSSSGSYSAATLTGAYANSSAMRQFIQSMVQKHGFSQYYLNGLFSQALYLPRVAQLENPPQTLSFTTLTDDRGSWSRYREKFLTTTHINDGVNFWRKYASTLQRASATYGVDPEYIVAIIGVETFFGKNVGKTLTIDALSTLAFNTPKRAKFFTSELENFLLIARDERIEPRKPLGSWAGAMGLGQFMPSSFRKLFVDFNRDGRRDLWHPEDVIGSVANYFAQQSGWRLGQAVARQTNSPYGTDVIKLSTYNGDEYWQVYPNFKVITTYNHSDKYAMAVHQLAQAIKQRY